MYLYVCKQSLLLSLFQPTLMWVFRLFADEILMLE